MIEATTAVAAGAGASAGTHTGANTGTAADATASAHQQPINQSQRANPEHAADFSAMMKGGAVADAGRVSDTQMASATRATTRSAYEDEARKISQETERTQYANFGALSKGGGAADTGQSSDSQLLQAVRSGFLSAGDEGARRAANVEQMKDRLFADIQNGATDPVNFMAQTVALQSETVQLLSSVHITSSIGTAGMNLFNSLLKNQQ